MENGERIESKGVVKIVILSIVILAMIGIAAVGAYSVENCPKCPESGFSFSATESWCMKSIWATRESLCCIYHTSLADGYSGGIYVRKYDDLEDAIGDFERERMSTNAERETVLKNSTTEFIFTATDEASLGIEIYGHFLDIEKKIITEVAMEMGVHIYGEIDNSGISDIAETKERFDAFAKCAHSITGWKGTEDKEEYTLTLKHYEPYYKPGKNDPRRPGDLVATLRDKESKNPVPNKIVVFYVEKDEEGKNLCKVTREVILPTPYFIPYSITTIPDIDGIRRLLRLWRFNENKFIRLCVTDSEGKARANYIHSIGLRSFSKEFSEQRKEHGENALIAGTIKAVALTQENSENKKEGLKDKEWKIECEKSVNIEMSSVAKITRISVHGEAVAIEGEERKIRVMKGDAGTIPVYDKEYIPQGGLTKIAKCTPYNLLPGDVILFDKNDYVELIWITGGKMKIRSKPGFFEEGDTHFAKLTISAFDFDNEAAVNKIYECTQDSWFNTVTLGGAGLAIGFSHPVSAALLGGSAILIGLEGKYFRETPYVIMRPKSKILVDPTSLGINFYTVEGSNELMTPKGFKRNVTTGHKISVLPDGTFSQISEFDRSELSKDLSYLLDSIEKDESETIVAPVLTPEQSKLEISKLYVEKPVYPRKTEVDVHYHIKNIGTVDVDEYHVEYKINDFKGNEVYKFVGSTHSIASGKQQKFVAAENWEIPSDARIGPYMINCTLIWDSQRDTAGREFFVTHPAKREDRTAELKISNLYTGKSEYLKGAGERVDVCYFVKNTGTVDISEYHVIYQIFDSEGKRYCWFISDMFGSIAVGKEDKWQSGVCNVPSDAKVGRYTVDAMVIWGLDRFSRETAYFFVK